MIVAVSNFAGPWADDLLAVNLAVLRARGGAPVTLADGSPRSNACAWSVQRSLAGAVPRVSAVKLAHAMPDHAVIVTDARDPVQCNAAYRAADVAVVAIPTDWGLALADLALRTCLSEVHDAHPDFQVIFVVVDATGAPSEHCLGRLRARIDRVPGARLSGATFVVPGPLDYGAGRCVCDAETCDPDIASALQVLFDDVYSTGAIASAGR